MTYEAPTLEVLLFDQNDIITTSGETPAEINDGIAVISTEGIDGDGSF